MKSFNRLFIVWTIVVILIFGALITFGFIYKNKIKKYHNYEDLLIEKAYKYVSVKNIHMENVDSLKINIEDLKNANLLLKKEIIDTCSGYVLVTNKSSIKYEPHIKCKYYKTTK